MPFSLGPWTSASQQHAAAPVFFSQERLQSKTSASKRTKVRAKKALPHNRKTRADRDRDGDGDGDGDGDRDRTGTGTGTRPRRKTGTKQGTGDTRGTQAEQKTGVKKGTETTEGDTREKRKRRGENRGPRPQGLNRVCPQGVTPPKGRRRSKGKHAPTGTRPRQTHNLT